MEVGQQRFLCCFSAFFVPKNRCSHYCRRNVMKYRHLNWHLINWLVGGNMSLICLIISVFSMINWIFNRFNIYFQTYSFILFPYIIKNCFEEKQKKIIYFGFIVCFFIFFYYDHVISMNVNYTSDFINF